MTLHNCSRNNDLAQGGKVIPPGTIQWSKIDSFHENSSSATLLQKRSCPICASTDDRPITSFSNFQFYSDSDKSPKRVDINVVQCLNCSAIYMNPCYSMTGFQTLFAEAGKSYGASAGRADEQIAWLSQHELVKSGTRILDVGCYNGQFLGHLPDNVYKVGVDIDLPAIELARRNLGSSAEFFHADFNQFSYSGTIDVIIMFHVLEHLPNPLEVLKNLRSLASPQTRLIVEVPVLEEASTNDICGFFSAQHLTHFSRTTLSMCLTASGWNICDSIQHKEYNGFRIIAKPTSPCSISHSKSHDTEYLYTYLSQKYSAIKDVEEKLLEVNSPYIVIWGGGLHSEFIYQITSFFHCQPERNYIIIDSDPLKSGKSWRGIPIYSPDILNSILENDFELLISSYGSQRQIEDAAIKLGVKPERIVKIYDKFRVY